MSAKKKRLAMGGDPLDAYLGPSTAAGPSAPAPANGATHARKNFTVELPRDLIDRFRATAAGLDLTLGELGELVFPAGLEPLEREHNRGRPFQLKGKLRRGPRLR
jgi:hypothetical protein